MATSYRIAAMLAVMLLAQAPCRSFAQDAADTGSKVIENEFTGNVEAAKAEFDFIFRNVGQALNAPMGSDVDRDLAAKIIALHQASIDVAQVILQLGSDPELRRIAVGGVQAEASAIADIRTWLSNRELSATEVQPSEPANR